MTCSEMVASVVDSDVTTAIAVGMECLCNQFGNGGDALEKDIMGALSNFCSANALHRAVAAADSRHPFWIVQLGASQALSADDAVGKALLQVLAVVDGVLAAPRVLPPVWKWLFLEPSPAVLGGVKDKVAAARGGANRTRAFQSGKFMFENAAMDDMEVEEREDVVYYQLSSDVNVSSGYDHRTGKTLGPLNAPSSQEQEDLLEDVSLKTAFQRQGLKLKNYVDATTVKVVSLEELLDKYSIRGDRGEIMALLIDTKDLDCALVKALDLASLGFPPIIVWENNDCSADEMKEAYKTTVKNGYFCIRGKSYLCLRDPSKKGDKEDEDDEEVPFIPPKKHHIVMKKVLEPNKKPIPRKSSKQSSKKSSKWGTIDSN